MNAQSKLRVAGLAGALAITLATGIARAADPIVLQWQTANLTESQYEPIWKKTIAEFEAANPGIRIEPVLVARKDHWTKFVAAAQAKQAPCIVSVDLTTAAYNGYLLSLDKFWNAEPAAFRAAWNPDILSAAKWKGQLYGLPIWGGTYGEIYNRDLVVKAGLDPAHPPKTFDEYVAWGKKLTGDDHWALAVLGGKTDTTTRVLPRRIRRASRRSRPTSASRARAASRRPRRRPPTISSRPTCSRSRKSHRCAMPTGPWPRSSATTRR